MQPDSTHPRRSSIASRIAGYVFLIITLCLLTLAWLVHTQLQWSIQQQADALGKSLLQQTRSTAEGALSANDTLSVAVLLRELVENPYVSHATLYSTDQRILAEAGKRPKTNSAKYNMYTQDLSPQNVLAGSMDLHIDMTQLQKPLTTSMQTIGAFGVVVLLFALTLSIHLGRSLALPLQALSNWLINPAPPAPHIQRGDEIGLLARQLNQYFIDDTQTESIPILEQVAGVEPHLDSEFNSGVAAPPLATDKITLAPSTPEPAQPVVARTAVLAIELNTMEQLRQLPDERRVTLLKHYNHAVKQAATLYAGQVYALADSRSLITFNTESAEYPRNAVCCAELLRKFSQGLQAELADTEIGPHLHLGLSEGALLKDASLGELLLNESTQTALALSQHSDNTLLISNSLAHNSRLAACALTYSADEPAETSRLESLLPTYQSVLDSQLQSLQQSS
ncbi:MAG: hypothetical protein RBR82_02640 [Pseudomonas sp.]|nr:hypothetical protein [Pseudomonas sp.]